ncbi:MAG TPA: DsbA family protein [Vicinamibacterales bacterium]|nr:DsbA family protein [Vicinamibacterales bacterium]
MIVASLLLVWRSVAPAKAPSSQTSAPAVPSAPLPLEGLPTTGSMSARAVMLVFSDFQCPFCAHFATDTMPAIRTKYVTPGLLRVVFRNLPLPIHSHAEHAAEGAQCAFEQGRFWAMHDILFAQPSSLDDLDSTAATIGLDVPAFRRCMAKSSTATRVTQDSQLAATIGLRATPSFIFGTTTDSTTMLSSTVIVGAKSTADFFSVIDGLLSTLQRQHT